MENTKNGTKPADCRRKKRGSETIIIEQNGTNSPWVGCINSRTTELNAASLLKFPPPLRLLSKAAKAFGAQPHAFQRHTNAMLTPAECG